MELVLGDNPFFGINHRSQKIASAYLRNERRFDDACDVIAEAIACGVTRLMVSTHTALPQLLSELDQKYPTIKDHLKLSLVLPYAHKYNQLVADRGLIGVFAELPVSRLAASLVVDFARTIIRRELSFQKIIRQLLRSEICFVRGFKVEYLCLQNIVSDMLLGLCQEILLEEFAEVVNHMGYRPLIITQNPVLMDKAVDKSIPICFSYNAAGFMVNPNLTSVRAMLDTERELWAMGILASGQLKLDDVVQDLYLKKFSKVLYATSRKDRVASAISRLREIHSE